MDNILNRGQINMLRRVATYPVIALYSLIASFAVFGCALVDELLISEKFGVDLSDDVGIPMLALSFLMFGVAAFYFIRYRIEIGKQSYRVIRQIARELYPNEPYARNARPKELCDLFKVTYNNRLPVLFLIVPIAFTMVAYTWDLANTASEYKSTIAKVDAAQKKIEKCFKDSGIENLKVEADDLTEYSKYHVYNIKINKTKDGAYYEAVFMLSRDGRISNVDYRYEFSNEFTINENLDNVNSWMKEVQTVTPEFKDLFENERYAEFDYELSRAFRNDVLSYRSDDSDRYVSEDSKVEHFRVYETCSYYDTPTVTVSYYYSEY